MYMFLNSWFSSPIKLIGIEEPREKKAKAKKYWQRHEVDVERKSKEKGKQHRKSKIQW